MEDSSNGECSSHAAGAASGLLPLFGPSPPPAESLEGRLRRASEENRRLAGALDAILADRPGARALAAVGNAVAQAPATADAVEPRPGVRTVCARAEPADADANHLNDGYHWRKYGQKVTRDNPYPRAYFRCAHSPSCPIKKKVQRSAEDKLMLVATYEGEHNHARRDLQSEYASSNAFTSSQQQQQAGSWPCSISIDSLGRTITFDLPDQQRPGSNAAEEVVGEVVTPEFRKVLVDELASLLKNDSEFMESLTSAVAARMMERIPGHIS
ncbi:hypothetical protein U9M48_014409 [Paspalum notatum var. saurae]|uniref:WRKY domain-containing protein n=1 Tax=Paspalum notatum var. saurae TaxID=547442 RepID=A0AAQ3T2W5_PASNO